MAMNAKTPCYTDERNAQILIALLKAHGITRVVASPGATNASFVWMLQNDEFFTLYSAVDERHASYIACGMAAETNEPVVLSCTGATSSRNYMSALTEAYYRKLPILAVTSSQPIHRLGHMWPQMTNRTMPPSDTVRISVQCPIPVESEEIWACEVNINKAILELYRHGGGPVHINLETKSPGSFPVEMLPSVRKISRIMGGEDWPEFPRGRKVAIMIGAHRPFTVVETECVEKFARSCGAVVFADRTSNYFGRSAINSSLLLSQGIFENPEYKNLCPDLVVHIGEISGDYPTFRQLMGKCEVWRVSEDGEIRDLLQGLRLVFEMTEMRFFEHYSQSGYDDSFFSAWEKADAKIRLRLPQIAFSNLWIAQNLASDIPKGAEVHFGILNSLRSWNMFRTNGIVSFCNVGGFGIDGCVSSLIGASFVNQKKLYFGVFGDLAFFYDLNSMGNRHIGKNLRILVVNNGMGVEFANPGSIGNRVGSGVKEYIAASSHFGCQSQNLLRNMAQALDFQYLSASNEDEFKVVKADFLRPDSEKPILLECFVDPIKDAEALSAYRSINGFVPPPTVRGAIGRMLPSRLKTIARRVGI